MKVVFRRKPSASMVVAIAALVISASGTAVAASGLVSGDKLIKRHSLSGNRLRNFTITRRQINFSRLGTVPRAANAAHATTADSATNANNANTLGGLAPTAFDAASNTVRTGLVGAIGNTSVTLATFGPFTLTLKCVVSGSSAEAQITVASSQPNSEVDGGLLPANSTIADAGPSSGFATSKNTGIDFISYGNGATTDRAEFFGDVIALVNYAAQESNTPCKATALISAS